MNRKPDSRTKPPPTPAQIVERAAIVRSKWSPETLAARANHYATDPNTNYYVGSSCESGWTPPMVATPAGYRDR